MNKEKIYIISYQLREDSAFSYAALYENLRALFPKNKHICENSWLVKTDSHCAKDIYNIISKYAGERDTLFIAEVNKDDCEGFIAKGTWEWIMS